MEESRRAVVLIDVDRVADSCGYGVPLMSFEGMRPHLKLWSQKRLRAKGRDAFRTTSARKTHAASTAFRR